MQEWEKNNNLVQIQKINSNLPKEIIKINHHCNKIIII